MWVWADQGDGMGLRWAWDGWRDGTWIPEPAKNPTQIATDEVFQYWESIPVTPVTGQVTYSKHLSYLIVPTANGIEYWIPYIWGGIFAHDGEPIVIQFPGESNNKGRWGANYVGPGKEVRNPAIRPPHMANGVTILGFLSVKQKPVEIWTDAYKSDDWTNFFADKGWMIVATVAIGAVVAVGGAAVAGGEAVTAGAVGGGEVLTGSIVSDAAMWESIAAGWESAAATSSLQNAALAAVGGDVGAYSTLVSAVGEVGAAEMMAEAASILSAGTTTTSVNLLEQLKDKLPSNISDKAVNTAINKAMSYGTKLLMGDPAVTPPGHPYSPWILSPVAPNAGSAHTSNANTWWLAALAAVVALKS